MGRMCCLRCNRVTIKVVWLSGSEVGIGTLTVAVCILFLCMNIRMNHNPLFIIFTHFMLCVCDYIARPDVQLFKMLDNSRFATISNCQFHVTILSIQMQNHMPYFIMRNMKHHKCFVMVGSQNEGIEFLSRYHESVL